MASEINLDSFLDILTCLVGVLVLIIILTSLDASQTKVLIPTPMNHPTDKRPVFIECRNNQLYHIDLETISARASERMESIADQVSGDTRAMLNLLAQTFVETDFYRVDLSYALIGQYALRPKEDAPGMGLEDLKFSSLDQMAVEGWYGELLGRIDPSERIISFLVRDDSFGIFKKARALAWFKRVEVSYELLDMTDPIKFGVGGERMYAQ